MIRDGFMPCSHEKNYLGILNKRKILWLLCFIFSSLFSLLLIIIIGYFKEYQNIPSEYWIGNKNSNVNALKEDGLPFSFLVIGDTHCSEKAETLVEAALKEGKPSFMIILGDFVKSPDIWAHRLFLTEVTVETKFPFPIFLVPGNHDIDYSSLKIKQKERRVTPEVYRSLYGAENFDFIFNNCLFIILGADRRNLTGCVAYLRDIFSKKGEGKKYIFVFIHTPPKGLAKYIDGFSYGEEFFSLLETYKVTTCFFGNHHGYWRGQRKGVNLVISGGGGGRLKKSKPEWGKFHHMLKVNVDENIVSEEMITLKGEMYIEDAFEGWIFTHLFPILQHRGWVLYFLFSLFLSLSIYSFIFFIKSLKRRER
jgi:hypothetical protein